MGFLYIMKRFILLIVSIFAMFVAKAQMAFVPADSVVFWGQDATNIKNVAMGICPSFKDIVSAAVVKDDLASLEKRWAKQEAALDAEAKINGYKAADQFYLAAQLLSVAQDAKYARMIEQLVFFPLTQCVAMSEDAAEKYVAAQALYNAVSTMFGTAQQAFYINFYANSSAFVNNGDLVFQVDVMTAMPYERRVKLRFSRVKPKSGIRFKVFLQLPEGDWSNKTLPVYCNGHDVDYKMERGYAVVENDWQSGFEIYFDLPAPLYADEENP